MKKAFKIFALALSSLRLIPHLVLAAKHRQSKVIAYDVDAWLRILEVPYKGAWGFIFLMTKYPEYRNLFYHRIGYLAEMINFLCPKMPTLYLNTPFIGQGLFIQHGFATIVAAKSIGSNCWINQQVTVGHKGDKLPIIGNNVSLKAGAKVIGGVSIGNNSIIGANAVVVKDIPANCTAVGIPAYVIKKNGVKLSPAERQETPLMYVMDGI